MSANTVRLHRVIRAAPERVYRAFLDADAWAKWQPPHGFTGRVHDLDARVGGHYRMSFTNFSSGHSHSFGGEYLELLPHECIRYTAQFDDPSLAGVMQTTVSLRKVFCGTDLEIVQEGTPRSFQRRLAIWTGRSHSSCWSSSSNHRFPISDRDRVAIAGSQEPDPGHRVLQPRCQSRSSRRDASRNSAAAAR